LHRQSDSLSYSLPIGRYLIVILDTRGSMYDHGVAYSHELINFTKHELNETQKNNIVIILPRPLAHLDKHQCLVQCAALQSTWTQIPVHGNSLL